MRIYVSESRVPELAGLNRVQRRIIFRRALKAMTDEKPTRKWVPVLFCSFGALLAFFTVTYLTGSISKSPIFEIDDVFARMLVRYAVVLLCGLGSGFIGQQILFSELRPYLRVERTRDAEPGLLQ